MAKLKGHAVIELTDVKTGKKERVEHDNIITNALKDFFDKQMPVIGAGNMNSYFLPIIEKALGGIFIFSNTLTENINNIVLPDAADAELTGYAGHVTSDGNDNRRGDFNAEESGAITNGYKFVWDFGTNDANGEIAALALTNEMAGYHGYHYSPIEILRSSRNNTSNTSGSYKGLGVDYANPMGLNDEKMAQYAVELDSDAGTIKTIRKTDSTTILFETYKIDFKTVKLDNVVATFAKINTETITISDSVQTETNDALTFVDGGDGFYYGLSSSYSSNTAKIKISKINKSTHEYTPATDHTVGNVELLQMGTVVQYMQESKISPVIRNGYIYSLCNKVKTNSRYTKYDIIKISLTNPAEFTVLPNSNFQIHNAEYGADASMYLQNGLIITNGFAIDSDDRLIPTGIQFYDYVISHSYACTTRITTDGKQILMGAYSNGSRYTNYYPVLQYLATINNLDAPVTKTAAKTMKITYTLTYAE